jgi:hypothetical protein
MMQGKSQMLISKFKITYNLILNLIEIGETDFVNFCKKSMIQYELDSTVGSLVKQINDIKTSTANTNNTNNTTTNANNTTTTITTTITTTTTIERYLHLHEELKLSKNKKRKQIEIEIEVLKDDNKYIQQDVESWKRRQTKMAEVQKLEFEIDKTENYLNDNIQCIVQLFKNEKFIETFPLCPVDDDKLCKYDYKLTQLGYIATNLREVHCLVFAKLIYYGRLDSLFARDLIALFSCFTNIKIIDELKTIKPPSKLLDDIVTEFNYYGDYEMSHCLNIGIDYDDINFDLYDYVLMWANCLTDIDCRILLKKIENEKMIFVGEFVKAIFKINNIAGEMERIAESIGNLVLLNNLKQIPELLLKFIVTNQSLYL